MPVVRDYRRYSFTTQRVDRCGRNVGTRLYWKLYTIENTFRVVIHSVLSAQIGPQWWTTAVDPDVVKKASRFRNSYNLRPQHANPGAHDIYLVFLSDLTEILRANSHLFSPVIPTTQNWITTLETIRVPRNLVGHMNFPNAFDRQSIDSAYRNLPALLTNLQQAGVQIVIP